MEKQMDDTEREKLTKELRELRRTVEAQNELLRQFVGVQEYLNKHRLEGTDLVRAAE